MEQRLDLITLGVADLASRPSGDAADRPCGPTGVRTLREPEVDLYSDTQTRPTDGMRRAIAAAEVGDEQRGEDPTVTALRERVTDLLAHEAALFLPSGTMCNQIAIRLHIGPLGDEMFVGRNAHPLAAEAGSSRSGLTCRFATR